MPGQKPASRKLEAPVRACRSAWSPIDGLQRNCPELALMGRGPQHHQSQPLPDSRVLMRNSVVQPSLLCDLGASKAHLGKEFRAFCAGRGRTWMVASMWSFITPNNAKIENHTYAIKNTVFESAFV